MIATYSLENQSAVVTGGFGLLGTEFSVALVEAGARVAILDVAQSTKAPHSLFDKYRGEKKILHFSCDITNRKSVEEAYAQIHSSLGVPSVLVNNAGLDSRPNAAIEENGPFEDFPEEVFDRIMSVNLKGTVHCCQVIGAAMAQEKRGSIINLGSIYGMLSPQHNLYEFKFKDGKEWYKPFAYSVSKAAIYNLTRYLATYWARDGVRVNTLSPAGISSGEQPEDFLREYTKRIPIGRMAEARDMRGAVLFLASSASEYVTGANLVVDGGWSAW